MIFNNPLWMATIFSDIKRKQVFSQDLFCMSETAAQEGQYRWSRAKFTHDTEVQYHHGTIITPQQNTIGRNPSPGPARGQSTYLHLQANILDAVTFLWSRWFSKTLQHSSTPAITLPYDRREMSPLFLHLFHPSRPLCCRLLFLLHCLPVLTTKAL